MSKSRVDYTAAQDDYMQHRQLQAGAAGWILLAGLSSNMTWYYVKRARDARRDSVTG